jgi:hypothetical protein
MLLSPDARTQDTSTMRCTQRKTIAALFAAIFLAAANADAHRITLAWDGNTEPSVAGYIVYYGTEPGVYAASVDVGNTLSWRLDLPGPQYYFAVRAYDADRKQSPLSLEVGDTPGVALSDPGDQFSVAGTAVRLGIVATGRPVAYSATSLPPGLSIDPLFGWITGILTGSADLSRAYVVTVRVSDKRGYVSSVQFVWTVRANHAPIVTTPENRSSIAGTSTTQAIAASDLDGDPLTVSAAGLPPGLTINVSTGFISGTVPADAAGLYTVTVEASDGVLRTAVQFWWEVSAPGAFTVDRVVHADGFGATVTTESFSTAVPGETLIAFATAAQPTEAGVQTASVSGGGLGWTLVTRANEQAGTSEIWQATASGILSDITVTATVAIDGDPLSLTVVAFAGSSGVGASAAANAATGAPTVSLTTTTAGSVVYGAGNDWDQGVARTPAPDQAIVHEFVTFTADTYWVQRYVAPVLAAGTVVALSDTAPTSDRWNFAAVEIMPHAAQPTVTAAPAIAVAGTTITGTVAHGPGNRQDWIGLFNVADALTFQSWEYLNGSSILPAIGLSNATVYFTAPSAPGRYNVRLFAAGDPTTPIATSNAVLVPSSLTINSVSVVEGNSGTTSAVFTVTLTPASPVDVTVNYATADGSATAGTDYVPATGILTFPAGVTARTIAVNVYGDAVVEPDETFAVNLSGAANAIIGRSRGVGTIVNDDVPERRMFGHGRIDEGHTRHWFVFRVVERSNREYGRLEYWSTDDRKDGDDDECDGDRDRDYDRVRRGVRTRFDSTAIGRVSFSDNPAFTPGRGARQPAVDSVMFAGTGRWNGMAGYTFEVRATDQGEPGRQRDTFSLIVKDSRGSVVINIAGKLDSGNIQSTGIP